ncbi:MAG TPA: alkaline phosphatase, partial [Firmicutes bacterium]|nr:alkaline phosphatase [Bacillota bacterium]
MYNAQTTRARIRRMIIPVVAIAFATFLAGCGTSAPTKSGPKNVIVLIGDGMGFAHVTASSYYETGKPDGLSYQQFPVQYGMSTYSASGIGYDQIQANSDFDYFKKRPTDSGAAATAMGTGKKSYNGAIGVNMDKDPIGNLCETAEKVGKASGVVTSVNFPHATPAGFIAHTERRGNLEDIARQMVFSNAEVI